jgi:hypothetical protein
MFIKYKKTVQYINRIQGQGKALMALNLFQV